MSVKFSEREEMESLSMILKELRKHELSVDLFPELKNDINGPYFIMQGDSVKALCGDIYAKIIEKYGSESTTAQ